MPDGITATISTDSPNAKRMTQAITLGDRDSAAQHYKRAWDRLSCLEQPLAVGIFVQCPVAPHPLRFRRRHGGKGLVVPRPLRDWKSHRLSSRAAFYTMFGEGAGVCAQGLNP